MGLCIHCNEECHFYEDPVTKLMMCSTCKKIYDDHLATQAYVAERFKELQEASARAAHEAAEIEAALTRRRQEEALALGAEPDMGSDVTRARESQLKEGEERLTREAEEDERKSKEEQEASARAAEEAERKFKEEQEASARAAEEAQRKFWEEEAARERAAEEYVAKWFNF